MVIAEFEFDIASVDYLLCSAYYLRHVREKCKHLRFGFDVKLVILKAHTVLICDLRLGLDAHQHILGSSIAPPQVMRVVGRHHRNAEFCAEFFQAFDDHLVLFKEVVLDFKEEVVFSENAPELQSFLFRSFIVPREQHPLHVAGQAARQADESPAELPQKFLIYPRLIVKSVHIALRNYLYQIAVSLLCLCKQY